MIYTEPLFLGLTSIGARNYMADKVASLKKPFFNACAGRFSVIEAAVPQIEDAESKLEAFVDTKLDVDVPKVKIEGLDIDLDFKMVLLILLPRVKQRLDKALEYIRSSGQKLDGVYIAADSDYAPLEEAVRRISGEYAVRVVADILRKMADLALQACGVSVEQPERVHLKDLFGTAWIPRKAASLIGDAVDRMIKAGDISQTNIWQALEY